VASIEPTLYGIPLSHPVITARLALAHKGLPDEPRMLLGGLHPAALRLAGFKGATVPALKLDGGRAQGSLAIMRALEEVVPSPRAHPANAADFQIAPSLRMLAAFDSLRARVEAHEPAHGLAFRLVPEYPNIPA